MFCAGLLLSIADLLTYQTLLIQLWTVNLGPKH